MTLADSPPRKTTLADLLSDGIFVDGDWVESKDQDPDGDVRLIQLADVGSGVFRDRSSRFLTSAKAKNLRCTFLSPGDILVARMPEPLGRACIFPGVGQPAVTAVDVCIIRPNPRRVNSEWLVAAINSPDFRSAMQQFVRGTTRQRISRKNLGTLELTVPDLAQQIEIASAIECLESSGGRASDHVSTAQRAIDRFRQALLASACSGRLTAEWRTVNDSGEVADEIVATIEEARRLRSGYRYKAPPQPAVDTELPDRWTWTTVGALVDVATGATPLRKQTAYYGGSIPWVTSGAVNAGVITDATEYITERAIRETNAKVFRAGTLLVAMYGEGQTRGRVAELGIDAATNQAVAALLFDETTEPLRNYLRVFFLQNYERIRQKSFGGVQPNLSLGVIRQNPVPLPPLDEQAEIVRRVDHLMQVSDGIRVRIESALNRTERSKQAVLARASRGELTVDFGATS